MIEEWINGAGEPAEIHNTGAVFQGIELPTLPEEHGLAILEKPLGVLGRSAAYPYGLTNPVIERLIGAGLTTVGQLANTSDKDLDKIDYIGLVRIQTIRDVVYQAIWM